MYTGCIVLHDLDLAINYNTNYYHYVYYNTIMRIKIQINKEQSNKP